jgi:hypothetical protein
MLGDGAFTSSTASSPPLVMAIDGGEGAGAKDRLRSLVSCRAGGAAAMWARRREYHHPERATQVIITPKVASFGRNPPQGLCAPMAMLQGPAKPGGPVMREARRREKGGQRDSLAFVT